MTEIEFVQPKFIRRGGIQTTTTPTLTTTTPRFESVPNHLNFVDVYRNERYERHYISSEEQDLWRFIIVLLVCIDIFLITLNVVLW